MTDITERKIHPDEVYKSYPSVVSGKKIIGIGASTGGVNSLLQIFKELPNNLPPIVITQHIPYRFSKSFAERLNSNSQINVSQLEKTTILEQGCAYVAPGNMHLIVERQGNEYVGKLLDIVKVSRHKPSVNIMFRSLNNSAGSNTMAIIMTGMGDDGAIAIKDLFDNNAHTVAQNEESCIVFGMPQQAIKTGGIKTICHLDDIAQNIINFGLN